MKQVGNGADFADGAIGKIQSVIEQRGTFERFGGAASELAKIELHPGKKLADTVVKFASNAAPLDILQLENACAEGAVRAQVLTIEVFTFTASGQFIEQQTEIENQKKNGSSEENYQSNEIAFIEHVPAIQAFSKYTLFHGFQTIQEHGDLNLGSGDICESLGHFLRFGWKTNRSLGDVFQAVDLLHDERHEFGQAFLLVRIVCGHLYERRGGALELGHLVVEMIFFFRVAIHPKEQRAGANFVEGGAHGLNLLFDAIGVEDPVAIGADTGFGEVGYAASGRDQHDANDKRGQAYGVT